MMVKKKKLEMLLTKVRPNPNPKILLEQYATPPEIASSLLYMAAYTFNDIAGKTVCDLGCGSGILAIGAAYLGAREVMGIDVDKLAVLTAKKNSEELGVEVNWVVGDIELFRGRFDVVLENPPFGVRKHGVDLKFLNKALSIADVVYSIHKNGGINREFIRKLVTERHGLVTNIVEAELLIPHLFDFHRKPRYKVKVDIYRIIRK